MLEPANKDAFKIPKSAKQSLYRFIKCVFITITCSILATLLIIFISISLTPIYEETEIQSVTEEVVSIEYSRKLFGKSRTSNYFFALNDNNNYYVNGSIFADISDIKEGDIVTVEYLPSETYKDCYLVCALSKEDTIYYSLQDFNQKQMQARILITLILVLSINTIMWMYCGLKYYPHEYVTVKRRHKEKLKKLQSKRK